MSLISWVSFCICSLISIITFEGCPVSACDSISTTNFSLSCVSSISLSFISFSKLSTLSSYSVHIYFISSMLIMFIIRLSLSLLHHAMTMCTALFPLFLSAVPLMDFPSIATTSPADLTSPFIILYGQ